VNNIESGLDVDKLDYLQRDMDRTLGPCPSPIGVTEGRERERDRERERERELPEVPMAVCRAQGRDI